MFWNNKTFELLSLSIVCAAEFYVNDLLGCCCREYVRLFFAHNDVVLDTDGCSLIFTWIPVVVRNIQSRLNRDNHILL